jgi:hypothetical protein
MDSPDILQNGSDNPTAVPVQGAQQVPVAVPIVPSQSAAPAPQPAQPASPSGAWQTALTGSFSDKLGMAMQVMGSHPAAGAILDSPGGFSKMILAAATDALAPANPAPQISNGQRIVNGVESFFAPLAQFSGSPIAGAGKVAAADIAERENARQQQLKEQTEQSREQRERLQTAMAVASSNSQMLHSQFLLHKAGVDEMNSNIADSNKAVETLKSQHSPGIIIGENLTSDDLKRGIDAHTQNPQSGYDMSTMTPYLTGKQQVGEDENGNPRYRGVYTLVQLPESVSLTDADEIKSLFPDKGLEKGVDASHPLVIGGEQYNLAFQRRETAQAATAATQKAANDAALSAGEQAEKIESMKFHGNEIWAQDLSTFAKQNPKLSYPEQVLGAYRMLQANPPLDAHGQKQYPNLERDVAERIGEKNFNSIETAAETARHNREEEQIKSAEVAAKKQQGIVSNLTGDDYLQSLPIQQRVIVQAIGEGRQVLPANRKESLALLEQVHQAFPDYDEKNGKTWQSNAKEYSQGKTGQAIVRANTALEHAKALYDETTMDAVLNPFSDAHQKREITLRLLSDEIGAAIKGGVVAQEEGKDLLNRLGGGLTVGAKRERIKEVTSRLHDRLEAQQDQLDKYAPSSAVKVPRLMTPRAALAYDYVQSDGKNQSQQAAPQQPQAGQVPAGGQPILRNGQPVGYILNGQRVNF